MINKTHSKKDMINMIQLFKIPIDIQDKNKLEISNSLYDFLISDIDIVDIPNDNNYMVSNKDGIYDYLKTINPKKILNVRDKANVISLCKKINQYNNNNYDISKSQYNNIDDIIKDVSHCSKYGDIPSVRKMIKKYNLNPELKEKINPIISATCRYELNKNKIYKQVFINSLKIKEGKFKIVFD
jgi:hypothetical protein